MNRPLAISTGIVVLMLAAQTVWAKGAIVKIVIDGDNLPSPIEIVDPEVLDRFTIWSGPGVGGWDMLNTHPKPDDAKFIVDWTQGTLQAPPGGSRHYLVKMYVEGREAPRDTYEVMYYVDGVGGENSVYIPSYARDGFGQWNTLQVYRGVEGNWFRATRDWDEVARPLLRESAAL